MRLILFGASDDCERFIDANRYTILKGELEIVAVADNDSRLHGKIIRDLLVISVDEIKRHEFDQVVVTPIFYDEILKQLVQSGIPSEKIVPLYPNHKEYFDTKERVFGTNEIGRYSYFKPGTKIMNSKIGSFCHIGTNCIIGQGGHNPKNVTSYPLGYHFSNEINDCSQDRTADRKRIDKKTVLGNDVYVGEGVVIFSGVEVGDGAVIASRAIVTKDVPSYSIVGGIPAKVLGMRFSNEQIERLLSSKWWNWSEDKILEKVHLLESSIEKFLSDLN